MHTNLSGLFVNVEGKEWQSFEDSNGKTVNGGSSFKVHLFDPIAKLLYVCKVAGGSNGITLDQATLDAVRRLEFGVQVDAVAAVKARNNVTTLTLEGIAPARKAA